MPIYIDVTSESRQVGKTTLAILIGRAVRAAGYTVQVRSHSRHQEMYLERSMSGGTRFQAGDILDLIGPEVFAHASEKPTVIVRDEYLPRPETTLVGIAGKLERIAALADAADFTQEQRDAFASHAAILASEALAYVRDALKLYDPKRDIGLR